MPKMLRMPKPNEHRNRKFPSARVSPAEVIQFPCLYHAHEEEASAAKIAKWLTLADKVLKRGANTQGSIGQPLPKDIRRWTLA